MHLIDEVDLEATHRRHVLDVVQQLTHIIYTGSRRCVHFNQINTPPLGYFQASIAAATGYGCNTCLTVQATRKDSCNRGLAHTACPRKKIGMMQPLIIKRIDQRLKHMLLPFQFLK